MTTTAEGSLELNAIPTRTQESPTQSISRQHPADERSEAVRAKRKKKRIAHRIALRRPHTNG